MDVVGGVIVAADHSKGDDLACGNRKRVASSKHHGAMATTMAVAWGAGDHLVEPWNYRHLKLSRTSNNDSGDDLHQDYDLRSVVSFRHSAAAAAAPPPPLLMHHAPVVVAPAPAPAPSPSPARSWVDPLIFLLKKELTVTDVGDLGRIILPKVGGDQFRGWGSISCLNNLAPHSVLGSILWVR